MHDATALMTLNLSACPDYILTDAYSNLGDNEFIPYYPPAWTNFTEKDISPVTELVEDRIIDLYTNTDMTGWL